MLGLPTDLYDVHDPVMQAAVNLFYGLGYNFYRVQNQLRADDLLVRHQVAGLIGEARVALGQAETSYRATIPPLTRAAPRPDPEMLKTAHQLELLVSAATATAGRIRSLPVPALDRVNQRHRDETDTLRKLMMADLAMGGHADMLKRCVLFETAEAIIAHEADIRGHLTAIDRAIEDRKAVLSL